MYFFFLIKTASTVMIDHITNNNNMKHSSEPDMTAEVNPNSELGLGQAQYVTG